MNLAERLIQADVDKAYKLKRDTFPSKRLAELLGEEEPVNIVIKEISQRRVNDLMSMSYSSGGKFQMEKTFDAKLMSLVEGVEEPSMHDKDLMAHFKAETPKKLAEVVFGNEITKISDAIMELSGVGKDEEDELKN